MAKREGWSNRIAALRGVAAASAGPQHARDPCARRLKQPLDANRVDHAADRNIAGRCECCTSAFDMERVELRTALQLPHANPAVIAGCDEAPAVRGECRVQKAVRVPQLALALSVRDIPDDGRLIGRVDGGQPLTVDRKSTRL